MAFERSNSLEPQFEARAAYVTEALEANNMDVDSAVAEPNSSTPAPFGVGASGADSSGTESLGDRLADPSRPHLRLVEPPVAGDCTTSVAGAGLADFEGLFETVEEQWQDRALCAQTDPEAFFPEKGGSTREAKRICQGCEVRSECLEYALSNDERFGIWGGLSERERRRLKRGII